MAPYLLADYPDDGAGAAVRRSVEMMRGRKWELFTEQHLRQHDQGSAAAPHAARWHSNPTFAIYLE